MTLSDFISTLKTCNAKGFLVGGAVRDKLLGIEPKDHDYCVTGITQEMFESMFPSAKLQGKDFPVYRMFVNDELCEVALARTERKVSEGHNGFIIDASPTITIQEDLSRRDLTINSMAIDLETDELIDPHYGEIDLQNGMIRATSDAFTEDPLRVYRAARFAAKYGFFVEYSTQCRMTELKSELSSLSIERVLDETNKALMTDTPSIFFRSLIEASVLDIHFPEINRLVSYQQNLEYHTEGNVFEHTMQVIDAARILSKELYAKEPLMVMYSALLHDVGKAVTQGFHPVKGTPTFISHEHKGVPIAEQFLNRFNLQSYKKAVLFNVENHMIFHDKITEMKETKVVDFIEGKFEITTNGTIRKPGILSVMNIEDYIITCIADNVGRIPCINEIPEIVSIMLDVIGLVDEQEEIKLLNIVEELDPLFSSLKKSTRMAQNLITAAEHKYMLEQYREASKSVICSLDIEKLKGKYSNEKLGFVIHSDKRSQRVAIMKKIRNRFKGPEYIKISQEKIDQLRKDFLKRERIRWHLKDKGDLEEFHNISLMLSGVFGTTQLLGIDLGIRQAGPFFKDNLSN